MCTPHFMKCNGRDKLHTTAKDYYIMGKGKSTNVTPKSGAP